MAWIESHDNLKDHPKTRRAARLLGLPVPTIIRHVPLLWHWCLSYAEDGDLSGYDAADIAEAVMWDGDPHQFIDALLNCGPAGKTGFLERDDQGRLLVHDWYDYAGRLLEKREEAREAGARGNHERWHVQRGIVDPTCPYCQEASAQDGQAIGSPSGGDSGGDSQPESEPNRVLSHRTVPTSTVHNQDEIDPPQTHPRGQRRRKRAADDEPDPGVQPVLRAFYDGYTLRFGKPPTEVVLNCGRDGKRVKKLPPAYTADELLEYIERFFRPDTPGWVTRDFSFQAFLQAIPRLQEVASGEHATVSGGHAASGRGGGRTASPHRGREATTSLGDRLDRGFFAGALQDDTA